MDEFLKDVLNWANWAHVSGNYEADFTVARELVCILWRRRLSLPRFFSAALYFEQKNLIIGFFRIFWRILLYWKSWFENLSIRFERQLNRKYNGFWKFFLC